MFATIFYEFSWHQDDLLTHKCIRTPNNTHVSLIRQSSANWQHQQRHSSDRQSQPSTSVRGELVQAASLCCFLCNGFCLWFDAWRYILDTAVLLGELPSQVFCHKPWAFQSINSYLFCGQHFGLCFHLTFTVIAALASPISCKRCDCFLQRRSHTQNVGSVTCLPWVEASGSFTVVRYISLQQHLPIGCRRASLWSSSAILSWQPSKWHVKVYWAAMFIWIWY